MPVILTVFVDFVLKIIKTHYKLILILGFILVSAYLANNWLTSHYADKYKGRLEAKDVIIEEYKEKNKQLEDAIKKLEQAAEIDLIVIEDNREEKEEIEQTTVESERVLESEINKIKKEYASKIKEDASKAETLIKEQEKAISAQRINSLWDTYCSYETEDPDCS
jgi:tRNA/tmRNA/rRNA uracil-C5-methylase (TrmA/RlmC/RlmD family)